MAAQNYLGIYIARDHATVVCLGAEGRERNVVGCFGVSAQQAEQPAFGTIAGLIAAGCADRQIKFAEAAVALDCAMFMQHGVHSEFTDTKKISQTVRFDTEEALATDVTDVAIAFRMNATDENGANLSVFTAQKQLLADLLAALQSNNIDPVSIEPDVNCLTRFVVGNVSLPADAHPAFALLSGRNGYLVTPLTLVWQGVVPTPETAMRTFLLSGSQDRTELLAKQVPMTLALLQGAGPVNRVEILDTTDSVDCGRLGEKLAVAAERIDLAQSAKAPPEKLAECPDAVEFAVAYGAAMREAEAAQSMNFRSDFMPYQGRKLRMQKALKFFSTAAVILMVAAGFYGLKQAMQVNRDCVRMREKFAKEFYSPVMFGQALPDKSKEAVRRLGTAVRRIKDAQKGGMSLTGEEAAAGKLVLVLQALNKCAAATGLNIESINITDKAVTISGDTSGPDNNNTLKVFEAIRQANLNVLQQRISAEGGRSTFSVTVEPRKQQKDAV